MTNAAGDAGSYLTHTYGKGELNAVHPMSIMHRTPSITANKYPCHALRKRFLTALTLLISFTSSPFTDVYGTRLDILFECR
jgi:hypothetical protein